MQTVKEVATQNAEELYPCNVPDWTVDPNQKRRHAYSRGFIAGAAWQSQQQYPKLPLSELAKDEEMLKEIADLCWCRFKYASVIDDEIVLSLETTYALCIGFDGRMSYGLDTFESEPIPNNGQIWALILSKYQIEKV